MRGWNDGSVSEARRLIENAGIAFIGDVKGGSFDIDGATAGTLRPIAAPSPVSRATTTPGPSASLDRTVADFGKSLRAGQTLALPAVPCRGDVFHAEHALLPLVTYLENRAYDAIACRDKIAKKQRRPD